MEQITKLYKFYLKRIFKKHWLRITAVSLSATLIFWIVLPLFIYNTDKASNKPKSYKENCQILFGDGIIEIQHNSFQLKASQEEIKKFVRKQLKEEIEKLEEAKKNNQDNEKLKNIKNEIIFLEIIDKGAVSGIDILPFTADNVFFFCQTEDYNKGTDFWKLINNISWWNLTGVIINFWVIFKVLDSIFSQPQKDGEEVMVLSFTPSIKRSDLLISKILAFLTFYTIINLLTFILPYGFYYWWVAKATSFSAFSLLTLYSTIIGPILYFGLILTPYLFINDVTKIAFSIFSFSITFFSIIWGIGKIFLWKFSTLPYIVEEKFFSPAIFIITSLSIGIIFLSLYYLRYQEKDLGN